MSDRITRENVEERVKNVNRRMESRGSIYRYQVQGRNGYMGLDRYMRDPDVPESYAPDIIWWNVVMQHRRALLIWVDPHFQRHQLFQDCMRMSFQIGIGKLPRQVAERTADVGWNQAEQARRSGCEPPDA